MGEASDERDVRAFLAAVRVGDVCRGTVAEVMRSGGVAITLDGFATRPLGTVGPSDLSWRGSVAVEVGRRVTAEVIAVDREAGRVRLSTAATENPDLWSFLKGLARGDLLSGVVSAIEAYGVFVALDDGPAHPVLPGVGFITFPELSWRRFEDARDVVRVGQRVSCEFLQFDSENGEARLSLRAARPDPFRVFAEGVTVGRRLSGRVTKLVPFGVFVELADGFEGFVHLQELAATPVDSPEDVVQVGDDVALVVAGIDLERRTLTLSRRQAPRGRGG
ncbi:S1 RNA-binding domain-containing protein [Streptomyces sp. NPDC101225]|uniref:S1 RNA-binding domain-containing protein n=1 Tax=Streptomyces sp. NPDC101225 TaxID=3366135 RepID=UPI00380E03C0